MALMAGYAAQLVNVAVSMVIAELLAMPPIADQGAKHHTEHAQAGLLGKAVLTVLCCTM